MPGEYQVPWKMAKQQAICLICIYGVCICSITFTIINVLICLPQTLLQYVGFLFHMKFVEFHCFNFIFLFSVAGLLCR